MKPANVAAHGKTNKQPRIEFLFLM